MGATWVVSIVAGSDEGDQVERIGANANADNWKARYLQASQIGALPAKDLMCVRVVSTIRGQLEVSCREIQAMLATKFITAQKCGRHSMFAHGRYLVKR